MALATGLVGSLAPNQQTKPGTQMLPVSPRSWNPDRLTRPAMLFVSPARPSSTLARKSGRHDVRVEIGVQADEPLLYD